MEIKFTDKLEQEVKVRIDKCKICEICIDHCDFGCPKENIKDKIVNMILKEINISKSKITYKCLYNDKFYNVDESQIV